ncbi:hypothetical protein RhiJN_00809 [Ceratobasidium sp. AG-Ba]|nr:hypothetical protein RhiJN_00809 [Ceratobasidium sp. AG-Ba]
MFHSLLFLALEVVSLVGALPAGGSGGSRGGSSGSSSGGSSGGSSSGGSSSWSSGSSSSGSKGGSKKSSSGYKHKSYHGSSGRSSGPLTPGAKIALVVVFSIFGAVILGAIIWFLFIKLRERWREHKSQESLLLEKQTRASSYIRASFDEHSNLSCNPGHTQPAVYPVTNPTSNAEMTSAVMVGAGSRAGQGTEGAGGGSRGGGAPVVWNARALAAISHGMSNEVLHQGHPIPENDHKTDKVPNLSSSYVHPINSVAL